MDKAAPVAGISLILAALLAFVPAATAHAAPTHALSTVRLASPRAATVSTDSAVTRTTSTPAPALLATAPQVGFKDQSFSGASTAPSGSKPESKLWFNDGIWWADMWDTTSSQFHIFRLT